MDYESNVLPSHVALEHEATYHPEELVASPWYSLVVMQIQRTDEIDMK